MEPKLSLKIEQKLVLTPTLQQAIKLLQLSKLELIQHIQQELIDNPVLEEMQQESALADTAEKSGAQEKSKEDKEESGASFDESPYRVEPDWNIYRWDEIKEGHFQTGSGDEGIWYENVVSSKQSLQDYLLWQLHLTIDDEEEVAIGEEIIGNIDDDGYLRAQIPEINYAHQSDEQKIGEMLKIIQSFDPPGVGARSIEECLLIQLEKLPGDNELAMEIVRGHLKKLENKNYLHISRVVRKSIDEVYQAARVIAGLEPKPGRLFTTEEPQYIIPDLYIYKVGEDYLITLNDDGLPKLRINTYYRRLFNDKSLPENTREYINKKFSSALWLIKSIHQRQKTISRVAQSIVRHQRDFLDQGLQSLKPMVLRDVAEDIGVHESTVSRVTSNKYAQTPQGLFELKFFFNTGIEKLNGPSMASASVQNLIQKIVNEEDPSKPLRDKEIVRILREKQGLMIARRTIAKYRKIMKILSASKRKTITKH